MMNRLPQGYHFNKAERIENGHTLIVSMTPERAREARMLEYSCDPIQYRYDCFVTEAAEGSTCSLNGHYTATIVPDEKKGCSLRLTVDNEKTYTLRLEGSAEEYSLSSAAMAGGCLYFTRRTAAGAALLMWNTAALQPQKACLPAKKPYTLPDPTADDVEDLRKALQNEFGVTIALRDEIKTDCYGYHCTVLTNDRLIYSTLLDIRKTLRMYPKGFFGQLSSESGSPIHIELVEDIHNQSTAGVMAPRAFAVDQDGLLVIGGGYNFSASIIFHEVYHLIYGKIIRASEASELLQAYYSLNPPGFSYVDEYASGKTTSEYTSFDENTGEHFENVYFASDYAKTNENEDVAELMGNLMGGDTVPEYYAGEHCSITAASVFGDVAVVFCLFETEEEGQRGACPETISAVKSVP